MLKKGTFGLLSPYIHEQRSEIAARWIQPNDTVLDLGCCTGEFQNYIPITAHYFGIDKRKSWNDDQKNLFHQDFGKDLPKKIKNQITAVVSLAVLEHLSDPISLFHTAHKNLSPKGLFILTTPHPISRRVHDWGAMIGLFSKHASQDHETFHGKTSLQELGKKAGFEMIHYQPFLFRMNQVAVFSKK